MSDHILAAWVDAAAKAMWETSGTRTHANWELEHPYIREEWWDAAREALEVVAPMIRADEARSIAKACDELTSIAPTSVGMVADLLYSRADKLEREAGQ